MCALWNFLSMNRYILVDFKLTKGVFPGDSSGSPVSEEADRSTAELEPTVPPKGDRSHLVVWQVAVPRLFPPKLGQH
jgi:hypothetical protein